MILCCNREATSRRPLCSTYFRGNSRSRVVKSAIFYFPFHKPKIPKILLYRLSIYIRSHFANNREGIDNPFIALGASWCLFVQVFGGLCVVSYWIDTLVLKTEGNTYSTLLHHPFLFKGKTNTSSRSSRKNFWRRCRGDLRQVKTYQVPIINSHLLHYIIRHSPLVFLSPTSKMIFEKICLFFSPLLFVFFELLVC